MLRDNRLRLLTLGRLTLVGSGGEEHESLAKRRRKLALLAVLAMARRPIARDTLVEMFWGAEDEGRARHSLSNTLSSLRGALGAAAIRSRDADVAVTAEAPLVVDALELADAVEGREFGRATELYAGPFLEGFFLDDSPTFEQWMSRERRRLEGLFLQACAQECATLARARRWPECHALARRWLDAQPLSPEAATTVLNAARAPGTRAALAQALEDYETLKAHLEREFDLPPEPPVRVLAEQIREHLATIEPEPPPQATATVAPTPDGDTASRESAQAIERTPSFPPLPDTVTGTWASPPPPARPRRRMLWGAAGAATLFAVVVLGVIVRGARQSSDSGAGAHKPVVAVLGMNLRTSDSSLAWLADGFPQMLVGKLSHNAAIDVVPPTRVRAVLVRSGHLGDAQLPDRTARDLAGRIGATLEVRGTIVRDAGGLVLDLTVHDVGTGTLVRSAVVSRADPLSLADEAAVRILAAANVDAPGGGFAGLETSSLEAYQHFIQALDAATRGRNTESAHELDLAIALDSGFVAAVRQRIGYAIGSADTSLWRRLAEDLKTHADRASDFDRLDEEAEAAYYSGAHEKAEALARELQRRWPRDPRTYTRLVVALSSHGKNEEAKDVARQGLALDSMAVAAGSGPCAPCFTFGSLVGLEEVDGNLQSAAGWGRRWIRAQPDAASAWESLAWTYAYRQQPDSAILLMRRAVSLSGGDLWAMEALARVLMVSRRYAAAESVTVAIESVGSTRLGEAHETAADLRSSLAREHGRFRESSAILKSFVVGPGANGFANLMLGDNRRWLGDYAGASRWLDSLTHLPSEHFTLPIPAGSARAYCWVHALAADAYVPTGDTIRLRAMADTLERGCGLSYYGRDWRLYHYIRGQIAAQGHRYAEAEQEFSQAIWSKVEGWTPIVVALANAQSAQDRPRDAIATLRTAYATRLDAMGRYVPISQLDYQMARAFAQAGEKDSARVYAGYVRAALRDADPEIRRQLASLP